METTVIDRVKKGATFGIREGTVKVIDTFRNHVFGEISSTGRRYYDFLTARPDPFEGVKLETSHGLPGLKFEFDGASGTPLSLSEMQVKWTDYVTAIGIKEANQREAQEAQKKRENEFAERKKQKMLADEFRDKCAEKLRKLAGEMEFNKFITNKDVRALYNELQLSVFYNNKNIS